MGCIILVLLKVERFVWVYVKEPNNVNHFSLSLLVQIRQLLKRSKGFQGDRECLGRGLGKGKLRGSVSHDTLGSFLDSLKAHCFSKSVSSGNCDNVVLSIIDVFITQSESFCLRLSSYCYSLILLANQLSSLTKMSTQVANCHPLSFWVKVR